MDLNKPKWFFSLVALIVCVRFVIGIFFIHTLLPVSVDDYFRVFHAAWWWDHISFTSSYNWLPGHQYIYGGLIGIFQETYWVPRSVTLFFHLATGIVFLTTNGMGRISKLFGLCWIYFSPLSLVIGTVPLTEAVMCFFLVAHMVALSHFVTSKGALWLFFSSVCLLLAGMVRYEIWLLMTVYVFFGRKWVIVGISSFVKWLTLLIPFIFPAVWVLHGAANPEGMFGFIFSVENDHLGQGSMVLTIQSMLGAVSLSQIAAGIVVFFLIVKQKMLGHTRFALQYSGVLLGLLAGLILTNSLPSQLTARIFYGPIILSAFFMGDVFSRSHDNQWRPANIGWSIFVFLLLTTGSVYIIRQMELGMNKSNYDVATWLNRQYAEGQLSRNDHTVVSKDLPDSAAVWILSNHIQSVHIDAIEKGCGLQFLSPFQSTCPWPDWSNDVQLLIVRTGSRRSQYAATLNWAKVRQIGDWVIYRRPKGTVFPSLEKPMHPVLMQHDKKYD